MHQSNHHGHNETSTATTQNHRQTRHNAWEFVSDTVPIICSRLRPLWAESQLCGWRVNQAPRHGRQSRRTTMHPDGPATTISERNTLLDNRSHTTPGWDHDVQLRYSVTQAVLPFT